MENKSKLFIFSGILTLIYLLTSIYFYYDYSNSIDLYNTQIYDNYNNLQYLVIKLHDQDSQLYKSLISKEINDLEISDYLCSQINSSSSIVDELFKLNKNNQISSDVFSSTVQSYYSLENLRNRITQIYTSNLETNKENSPELALLIREYEKEITKSMEQINKEIELNKEQNLLFYSNLKHDFILKNIILFIIYIVSLISVLYFSTKYDNNKSILKTENNILISSENILDQDMQKILSYLEKEIKTGNFPTIKEVKFHLKLSHPTILIKLNELEKRGLISIKKNGRNKHIFFK